MWLNLLIVLVVVLLILYIILWIVSRRKITKYSFDQFPFYDDDPVVTIVDPPSVEFSLVVPAYKEAERIEGMLDDSIAHLETRAARDPTFTYEVVIVNDGSTDNTVEVVRRYIENKRGTMSGTMRLLDLVTNFGKGFAVRQGMLRTRGRLVLFADADAASQTEDMEKLESELRRIQKIDPKTGKVLGVAIGSRYVAQSESEAESQVERTFIRGLLSSIFHVVFKLVTGLWTIKDSQCGFKLCTREAAAILLTNMKIDRWAMDIELVMLSQRFNIPLVEVPISWHEVEGSKFDLWGAAGVLRDLILIRLFLDLGLWRLTRKPRLPGV